MRILAGRYKGHLIKTLSDAPYRPTQTRIRKSLFDILGDLTGFSVLDLFAGTGILGFEAASRGANQVAFVERNQSFVRMIRQSSSNFKDPQFYIYKKDVFKFLQSCSEYDLVMADPPFGKIALNSLIDLCLRKLNLGGRLVLETSRKEVNIHGDQEKLYGDTKLIFWSNKL